MTSVGEMCCMLDSLFREGCVETAGSRTKSVSSSATYPEILHFLVYLLRSGVCTVVEVRVPFIAEDGRRESTYIVEEFGMTESCGECLTSTERETSYGTVVGIGIDLVVRLDIRLDVVDDFLYHDFCIRPYRP